MQNKQSLTFERLSKTYLENNVSDSVIQDIILFAYFLKTLNPSQKTHYHLLDDWSNEVCSYLHNLLDKYNFVNGDMETNSKNPNVMMLWSIYTNVDCFEYSPFYKKEDCAIHHASAYNRNNALLQEIDYFLSKIPELEVIKTEKTLSS